MLCKGFTIPNFNPKKDNFFVMLHFTCTCIKFFTKVFKLLKQEGHDGPVSLHWLIREIHSYQTLHYLGIGLKHKTPYED